MQQYKVKTTTNQTKITNKKHTLHIRSAEQCERAFTLIYKENRFNKLKIKL